MITEKMMTKSTENSGSEFDQFIKKFNLEGAVSSEGLNSKAVKDNSVGNCCGTCEFCPLG